MNPEARSPLTEIRLWKQMVCMLRESRRIRGR
jgi:hypothetical protein